MAGLSAPSLYRNGASLRRGDGALFVARDAAAPQLTPTTGEPGPARPRPKPKVPRGSSGKAEPPPALRNLPDPDNSTHNLLAQAFVLYHDPQSRATCCLLARRGQPHPHLPLRRVVRSRACDDDACSCLPDYVALARRGLLVASYDGAALAADGRYVERWFSSQRCKIDTACYKESEALAAADLEAEPMETEAPSPPAGRRPLGSLDQNSAEKRPAAGEGSASKRQRACRRSGLTADPADSTLQTPAAALIGRMLNFDPDAEASPDMQV